MSWNKYKLSEILTLIGGGTPKTTNPSYWGGNIPWLSVVDFNNDNRYVHTTEKTITEEGVENSSTKILPQGSLILSARGTVGALAQLAKPMAFNQSCYGIIAKEQTTNDFLYYLLKNVVEDLQAKGHGSVFNTITRDTFDTIEISLPPLEEQKRIADILGAFDDKIELLQKQNKTLEDMAKALFKSWFVDFDVVRAKQKGLPKADIMREYHLTDELYDLFPSSFADSPLGPIPSGWEVKPLSKIATFLNGLALQKYPARAEEDFLPVIKIAELRNGISTSTDKANTNLPTEYIVHNGDILFSWSGSLMVKVWSGEKGALNQHLFKVFSNGYPKWFYYLRVNHYLPMFQEIAADKATTMGHIQRKHLDQAKVVCPSAAFLDKMDKIFGVILSKIILNNKQIQTLTELRDSLLPRLISGKIRV